MKFAFKWGEGEQGDEFGWVPSWIKNADPTNPRGMAHDICEHVGDQSDPAIAEIMAMGAYMVTRGDYDPTDDGLSIYRQADQAAMEVARILCDHDIDWLPILPKTPSWTPFNALIDDVMEKLPRWVRSEFESYDRDMGEYRKLERDIFNLLRLGALKMWERCGRSHWAPQEAFHSVYWAAQKHFTQGKNRWHQVARDTGYCGEQLVFQVNFKRAQVTSQLVELKEY
jgi:hypothetical protein